ncbi:myosin heavy chain, clone 203-like [Ptychodera flava]|uniref:myosin heavy chain, clone 203-like n=1 Tax=Ptychodera flava TaxID=63121 RepID=UPI00396A908B
MGNIKTRNHKLHPMDSDRNDDDIVSDFDVDVFNTAFSATASMFEKLSSENRRLRKRTIFGLFKKRNKESEVRRACDAKSPEEIRSILRELSGRVTEMVRERNKKDEKLEVSKYRLKGRIDSLNLRKRQHTRLQKRVADQETIYRKLDERVLKLKEVRDKIFEQLCVARSGVESTKDKVNAFAKQKRKAELEFQKLRQTTKLLEEKMAWYKRLDVEVFALRKDEQFLQERVTDAEKENMELRLKIIEIKEQLDERK